ncbi:50S ribosomal protein L24e [Candidatus Woesearchaeota archaeon]|nr:50S ribosomal protein L24e [Candidatus Woesearchaeota archaeon]
MVKCTFCGFELRPGTGKMFVHVDGKVAYFCSSKCEKNQNKLGRKAIATKWTKRYMKDRKVKEV